MSINNAELDEPEMSAQDIAAEQARGVAEAPNGQLEVVARVEQAARDVEKEAEEITEDVALNSEKVDPMAKVILSAALEAGKKFGLATGLLVKNETTPEPDDVQASQSANSALAAASVAAPVASMAVAAARSFSQHFDDIRDDMKSALPENVQDELKNLGAPLNDFANADFKISQADGLEVATQGLDPSIALGQDAGLQA